MGRVCGRFRWKTLGPSRPGGAGKSPFCWPRCGASFTAMARGIAGNPGATSGRGNPRGRLDANQSSGPGRAFAARGDPGVAEDRGRRPGARRPLGWPGPSKELWAEACFRLSRRAKTFRIGVRDSCCRHGWPAPTTEVKRAVIVRTSPNWGTGLDGTGSGHGALCGNQGAWGIGSRRSTRKEPEILHPVATIVGELEGQRPRRLA